MQGLYRLLRERIWVTGRSLAGAWVRRLCGRLWVSWRRLVTGTGSRCVVRVVGSGR